MLQWLKTGKIKLNPPAIEGLPDPLDVLNETGSERDAIATQAANDDSEFEIRNSRKRKRGNYSNYSDEVRAKIAKSAVENGVAFTSRKYSKELDKTVSETSVRSMRDAYIRLKKSGK